MLRAQLIQFASAAHFLQDIDSTANLHSPYGDAWDFLPLGHCGARSRPEEDAKYWVIHDDPTVTPDSQSEIIRSKNYRVPDTSATELQGNFTRLVYEPRDMRCMYAYAISLKGAERMLYSASVEPGAGSSDSVLSGMCTFRRYGTRCIAPFPAFVDQYRPAGPDGKSSDRVAFRGGVRDHGSTLNVVFPVKAGLQSYITSSSTYASQWPDDSLWPQINPAKDVLPAGRGVFLTKDKFLGYQ